MDVARTRLYTVFARSMRRIQQPDRLSGNFINSYGVNYSILSCFSLLCDFQENNSTVKQGLIVTAREIMQLNTVVVTFTLILMD
jgi:hypothetical protein